MGPATLRVSEELPAEVTVDSRRVAKLAPIVSGTVRQVRRKLGDRVARGEVVAIIESLEMADARLKYIEATHRRRFAQEALRREEMLYRKKISAEEEFLRRRHASEEAQIAQDVARQHLEVFGMPREAIAKLEGRERGRLADCSLKAPAAGTILEMSAVVGGPVARGKELLVVADLSRVLLEVRVPVGRIGRLRVGQALRVRCERLGLTASGRVTYLAPVADPATRTILARLEVANARGDWRPGLTASVVLESQGEKVPVAVPNEAVHTVDGAPAVFVQGRPRTFVLRPVTLGNTDGRVTAVPRGLAAGERVATRQSFLLRAEWLKRRAE